MAQENYSALTFQQLRERLDGLIQRIKKDGSRKRPVDALYAEVGRVITALDQIMERHKGTPAYDQYQQSRKAMRELPILPSGFDFSRQ